MLRDEVGFLQIEQWSVIDVTRLFVHNHIIISGRRLVMWNFVHKVNNGSSFDLSKLLVLGRMHFLGSLTLLNYLSHIF